MGCFRFCFVLFPTFFSVVALVLSCFSCAGSARNNSFLTNIFLIDLDFSEVEVPALLANLTTDSGISDTDIGLSDVYTIGMWGYCKGDLKNGTTLQSYDTGNVNFTYCSTPKAMYVFNVTELISSELNLTDISSVTSEIDSVVTDVSDIDLPSNVESYVKVAKILSKLIFVCTIIGIVLTFLVMILTIPTICSRGFSCFVALLSFISFISFILACGASTGMYLYIKKELDKYVSTYGIEAHLSPEYLGFYWAACASSLIASVLWAFSSCCFSTEPTRFSCCSRPMRRYEDEEVPMIKRY
ncbi:hypothetical protein PACTADRAFT_51276 [Pachysolen tannophilus NRRL Y-2460]|uniref:Uncharacterized protein n=1 Tax=Pachysolen tannophilus NRRL Y-2460 TaxID=669874 RepID=A0A1E4TRR9_PACTA|nr:hypothetical protein PACTADRAFT_51276 [Pachysolen tannophilus NRRL Y-2460]